MSSVDANGLMGGAAILTDRAYRAVLWEVKKGTYECIHPSGDDYAESRVFTVNASGDAVGWVVLNDGTEVAWVWPKGDGTGEALPGLSDYYGTRANAINSSGMIVGQGQVDPSSLIPGWSVFPCHPLVWIRKGKSYELLDLADDFGDGYPVIRAYDVSEDGEVIGRRWDESLYTAAWSWTVGGGLVVLDDDARGDASAWRVAGKTITGGVGFGPLGSLEADWISDDSARWVNDDLEIAVTEVSFDGNTYDYVDGASANKSGLVTGFCFRYPADPPFLPLGWMAEKK